MEDRAAVERAFDLVRRAVLEFGSALDAYDRGFLDAATRIETDAAASIRAVLASGAIPEDLLPRTRELAARSDVADRGREILDELDETLRRLRDSSGSPGEPRA